MKPCRHIFFKNWFGSPAKTSAEHQKLLARFHQSQMIQGDFATRHGVGLSTLSKWLRCEDTTTVPPAKFQEVMLHHPPPHYAAPVTVRTFIRKKCYLLRPAGMYRCNYG